MVQLRLPPPAEFLWQYVACTPLALMMGQLDDDARAALEREIVASGSREWTMARSRSSWTTSS